MDDSAMVADETVVFEGKLHWGIFLFPAFLCCFGGAAVTGLLIIKQPVAAGVVAVAVLACAAPALIRYNTNGLILTNKRVISHTGIVSRRSIDMTLAKIEGVSVEQNLLGQMLNYGTVVVRGTGGGIEKFRRLGAPAEFSRRVHAQLAKERS